MKRDINIICAEALLRLREIKDLIHHTVKPLAEVQDASSASGILFALGDALQQHGVRLQILAAQTTPDPMKLTPPPPVEDAVTEVAALPSSIPADEEPESSGYHGSSGVHRALRFVRGEGEEDESPKSH